MTELALPTKNVNLFYTYILNVQPLHAVSKYLNLKHNYKKKKK